jgi:hypothetical protein
MMPEPQQSELDLIAASLVEEPDEIEPFEDEPNGSVGPGSESAGG